MPNPFINSIASWFLKKRYHQIELFIKYPNEVQNDILSNLVNTAKDTLIGKQYDFNSAIDSITQEIYEITDADILVDTVNLPTNSDKNNCMQIKPDISLGDNGIEISVPITTRT